MSALPPIATAKADSRKRSCLLYPRKRTLMLFDHLVSLRKQRRRDPYTECLGGLEIDYQLVLGRRLYRQVRWLLALEDAIDIARRLPELIDVIRTVRDQASIDDMESSVVDRGEFVPRRRVDIYFARGCRQAPRRHYQAAVRRARELRDGTLDLIG